MVIDSSALVAVLCMEPEASRLVQVIEDDAHGLISAAAWLESSIVIEARYGETGGRELDLLRAKAELSISDIDPEQAEVARRVWRRYGKGRHPAGLNFCDCFSYALAAVIGEPLLFKGDDFSKTDIDAVPY